MQNDNEFRSFSEAYIKVIADVLTHGKWVAGIKDNNSVGSDFGARFRRTKELLVYTFCISDPRRRNLYVDNWQIRRPFLLANFLWTLLGTKKGEIITVFNERGNAFLDEKNEFNSALGPHMFKMRSNSSSEFSEIERLLRRDPTTRRAVLQFFMQKDIDSSIRDVPCYNHMQFFIREGELQAHVVMRSQNALTILPYDFFLFSLVHEALSVRLAIKLGKLYYTANSLHIYEDSIEIAQSIRVDLEYGLYLIMNDFSDNTINKLKNLFRKIVRLQKTDKMQTVRDILNNYDIDEYWKHLIEIHFAS